MGCCCAVFMTFKNHIHLFTSLPMFPCYQNALNVDVTERESGETSSYLKALLLTHGGVGVQSIT